MAEHATRAGRPAIGTVTASSIRPTSSWHFKPGLTSPPLRLIQQRGCCRRLVVCTKPEGKSAACSRRVTCISEHDFDHREIVVQQIAAMQLSHVLQQLIHRALYTRFGTRQKLDKLRKSPLAADIGGRHITPVDRNRPLDFRWQQGTQVFRPGFHLLGQPLPTDGDGKSLCTNAPPAPVPRMPVSRGVVVRQSIRFLVRCAATTTSRRPYDIDDHPHQGSIDRPNDRWRLRNAVTYEESPSTTGSSSRFLHH